MEHVAAMVQWGASGVFAPHYESGPLLAWGKLDGLQGQSRESLPRKCTVKQC